MYQKKYIVSNNDVDKHFKLKIPAIFRYFQDVALLATESSGVDSISLSKKNIDWVITRMTVQVKRLPKCDEEITVCTHPGKDMAMLYPRYFYIMDAKGEIIVSSSSIFHHLICHQFIIKSKSYSNFSSFTLAFNGSITCFSGSSINTII